MNFNDHVESRRIIVEEDSLFRLFVKCRMEGCSSFVDRDNLKKRYIGALLEVKATCNEHHETTWLSGAMVGEERCKTGVINLLLATFCLTVGLRFKQVQDFFSHMRIAFFSESFYYNLQESVLEKAVWFHWLFMQQKEIEAMKKRASSGAKIKLAGDGQFDSPGFSAMYCTYSVQDLDSKKIVGLYVARKDMVRYSGEMEPYAAKTILLHLTHEFGLKIDSITTDRSTTMRSMIKGLSKELPVLHGPLTQYFDIWHNIKGIKKDVYAASQLKSCQILELWSSSITNMLWYSFGTSIDNPEMIEEKIYSILGHIANEHTFEGNRFLKHCEHDPLPLDGNRTKPWVKKGTPPWNKVKAALEGKDGSRISDIPMMAGFTHTGDIEQYLHNKYAPKNTYFSHKSMLVRAALTAMDHNINADRSQVSFLFFSNFEIKETTIQF